MLKSLYDIRIDHLSLLEQINEADGELSPEIESSLSLTQEQFQDKAISYGFIIKTFDDNESLIDGEIKRLTELKKKASKHAELFKQRLSEAMQQFGVEKITTPTLTLSFRKSESVEITDEKQILEDYIIEKIVRQPSKELIKADLKRGLEVPGATLITKQNLQIK